MIGPVGAEVLPQPQAQQRQHRAGRQREEQVDDVVPLVAHPRPHQRKRMAEIAERAGHAGLVHAGAAAPDAVDREQPLCSVPVPEHLGTALVALARGDDVHRDAARRQATGDRLGGDARAASQRGELVVQQQDAHRPRDNSFECVVVSSFLSDADLAGEGARGKPVGGVRGRGALARMER